PRRSAVLRGPRRADARGEDRPAGADRGAGRKARRSLRRRVPRGGGSAVRWLVLLLALLALPAQAATVGSKKFTEGVILGEVARLALERAGVPATHRRELGGSRILWDALRAGDIDLYPDYTGTLRFEILSGRHLPDDAGLPPALAAQ